MNICKGSIVLFATCICIAGCQKTEATNHIQQTRTDQPNITIPPDSLLDTKVNATYQGRMGESKVTLRRFIDKGINLPGKWKKVNDRRWLYKTYNKDPVTDKTTKMFLLFQYEQVPLADGAATKGDVITLDRVVVSGKDIGKNQIYDFFTKISDKL
jgi:hypothetical protein